MNPLEWTACVLPKLLNLLFVVPNSVRTNSSRKPLYTGSAVDDLMMWTYKNALVNKIGLEMILHHAPYKNHPNAKGSWFR